jgi:nonribosomal peptide synthetase protein VioO
MPWIGDALRGHDVVGEFLAAGREFPKRPAVIADGRELTYAELEALVSALAERLGPRPGAVGVRATHAPGTIVGLLGVWAAGGTYCPMDPAFPAQRRTAMLTAAGCRLLLDAGSWPGSAADVELVGPADQPGATEPEHPMDLAYILFTSGSTGEPKPVVTPRSAIAAAVRSLCGLLGLTEADRVLQFASLNWDTCFEEILPALTTGAALVFHGDAHRGSFRRFLRMIESERITVLDLPTAYWHELVNHMRDDAAPLPECVRVVVIGGEAVNAARLSEWSTLDTQHARLINTYGCTETTLVTHAVDLCGPLASRAATWNASSHVPIGRALPHVVDHITDSGELLIGGPSVAAGYRGLRDATEARFVTVGERRFFRTGDRVSRMDDGTLAYDGRVDDQIKIRGMRVDPAEVEAHIAGHPAVGAVAVTGVRVADRTVLTAYVVPRQRARTTELDASIVDYLRTRVPAHLIPSRVRVVPDLVYTASGKVDRHRIKETLP